MIEEPEDGVLKSEITAWLDDVIAANPPAHPLFVLPNAIRMARELERDGGEEDTRRLIRLLNLALDDAAATEDPRKITYYGSALLAALSALADGGDEGMADVINRVVPLLDPAITATAREWVRERAEGACAS